VPVALAAGDRQSVSSRDTKMTIAAERLAVIAVLTLPITLLPSVMGMNVIVNDHTRWRSPSCR
jgi:Mg2+ and Co2+ transporter CorA